MNEWSGEKILDDESDSKSWLIDSIQAKIYGKKASPREREKTTTTKPKTKQKKEKK